MSNIAEERSCSSVKTSKEDCENLVDCYWCTSPFEKTSSYCFEGSLWHCPLRVECQRSEEELFGWEIGTPSPYLVGFSLLCFVCTALLIRKSKIFTSGYPQIERRRQVLLREVEDDEEEYNLLTSLYTPSETGDHEEEEEEEERVTKQLKTSYFSSSSYCRPVIRCLIVFGIALCILCFISLVLSPADTLLTICDIRFDLGSIKGENYNNNTDYLLDVDKKGSPHILAEVQVSIWNPNRFDVDVSGAAGELLFHEGSIAKFHWEPRDGIIRISSGYVYDTRLVMEVEWKVIEAVPKLIIDWASVEGILMSIDAFAFLNLHVFGIELPKISLGLGGSDLPITQQKRDLCRCTTS